MPVFFTRRVCTQLNKKKLLYTGITTFNIRRFTEYMLLKDDLHTQMLNLLVSLK